jgi:nucleotide-binding universal stress UspA family protein
VTKIKRRRAAELRLNRALQQTTSESDSTVYSRILVAIDGSRTGDLALTEAVRLAEAHGATLRIAHVIDAAALDADFASLHEFTTAKARAGREILDEAVAFAKKAGLRVETRLLETDRADQRIVDVLAEEARAWPADLVVIGTHGRRGVSRVLLGSVADEFVRIAPEHVLLVREKQSE